MKFSIQSDDGDAVRVQVAGRITQKDVSPFLEPLGSLLGSEGYSRDVLLDMQNIEFLDSSGVGWLLACQKKFRNAGGRLVLHSLSPIARDVLKVLNMHLVFKMAENEDEALRMIRGDAS